MEPTQNRAEALVAGLGITNLGVWERGQVLALVTRILESNLLMAGTIVEQHRELEAARADRLASLERERNTAELAYKFLEERREALQHAIEIEDRYGLGTGRDIDYQI